MTKENTAFSSYARNLLADLKTLRWQNFAALLVAGCVNASAVTLFLLPVNLYDSGISGTSILLSQLTPDYLTLSMFLLILNIPLFLFGLKKQGAAFTVYSIFAVAVYSAFAWVFTNCLPIDVSSASPFAGNDLLLCALFGGIISGAGSGLTIRYGGAIDGIEVMAVIFAKRLCISVGNFVLVYNVILYILCGIVTSSWILPLYSIVTYAAGLKTIDFIVEGIDRSKQVMIITDKPNKISKGLMSAFGCGTTKIAAKGGYSNADKTFVYFVVNRFQISRMRLIIQSIDPHAFVAISEVADVFKFKSGDSPRAVRRPGEPNLPDDPDPVDPNAPAAASVKAEAKPIPETVPAPAASVKAEPTTAKPEAATPGNAEASKPVEAAQPAPQAK